MKLPVLRSIAWAAMLAAHAGANAGPLAPAEPTAGASGSQAPAAKTEKTELDRVEVSGLRLSLERSARLKEAADQVAEIITSEDMGKLPDTNVAESLQRVPGVQIERNFGEGAQIAVRGLTQVRVEINGRSNLGISIGPTGNDASGRSTGLEQLSSTMFSTLSVFKSPTPDQIEGGLGGFVSMKTPDGFDFKAPTFGASVEYVDSSLANPRNGQKASVFFGGAFLDGRLGIAGGASHEARTIGAYQFTRGLWGASSQAGMRRDFDANGMTDYVPTRVQQEYFDIQRKRSGGNLSLKFKASESLTLYADALYSQLETDRDTSTFQFITTATGSSASVLSNGIADNNYVVAGTLSNQRLRAGGVQRNEPTRTIVAGTGFEYDSDRWALKVDLGRSEGRSWLDQDILELETGPYTVQYNYRTGDVPSLTLPEGTDLTKRSAYTRISNRGSSGEAIVTREDALRLDGTIRFGGVLESIQLGVRLAELTSERRAFQSRVGGTVPLLSDFPAEYFGVESRTMPGLNGNFPPAYLRAFPWAQGGDPSNSMLIAINRPLVSRPALNYDILEKTQAIYLRGNLEGKLGGMSARGNLGVRLVETDFSVLSAATVGSAITQQQDTSSYRNMLPSANFVLSLRKDLRLRASASKVLARARLQDLAPFLFVDTGSLTATGGNAQLKPITATQGDLGLEWYFAQRSYLSATAFQKSIANQVTTIVSSEVIPGFEGIGAVQRRKPVNLAKATISGLELQLQHTFDTLPGFLKGLGTQLNLTLVDSKTEDGLPVLGMSKKTANAVLFYENEDFTVRTAYNWRSRYATGFTVAGALTLPNWHDAFDQLDLSASFKINKWATASLGITNMLVNKGERKQYTETENAVIRYELNDRQIIAGLRVKF